ncbi:MAG: hypothetical protein VYA59_01045 [Pseudomonadota bacterium]|mgnify:FL=1|jgi:hypothetical protein|nr:hypothetical protein [Pseudomonadota bacterium]
MTDRRRHHDMGGLEDGPMEIKEHISEPWEKRVDAIRSLLSDEKRNLLSVDELRRAIEDLGADAYNRYNYYERWMAAMTNILLEKKILGVDELGRKMAEVEAHQGNKPI